MDRHKESSTERRRRQVEADRAKWCANPPHLSEERRAKLLDRLHKLDRKRGQIAFAIADCCNGARSRQLSSLLAPIDRELAVVREALGLRSQLEVA